MKRVRFFPPVFFFIALAALPSHAQDAALLSQSESSVAAAGPGLLTSLQRVLLAEPVTEEGFATIRITDADGEAVYRGMIPVVAGAQSLDLSRVTIPASGRHSLRVVYPGGTLMKELESPFAASQPDETTAIAGR